MTFSSDADQFSYFREEVKKNFSYTCKKKTIGSYRLLMVLFVKHAQIVSLTVWPSCFIRAGVLKHSLISCWWKGQCLMFLSTFSLLAKRFVNHWTDFKTCKNTKKMVLNQSVFTDSLETWFFFFVMNNFCWFFILFSFCCRVTVKPFWFSPHEGNTSTRINLSLFSHKTQTLRCFSCLSLHYIIY